MTFEQNDLIYFKTVYSSDGIYQKVQNKIGDHILVVKNNILLGHLGGSFG